MEIQDGREEQTERLKGRVIATDNVDNYGQNYAIV